MKYAIALFFVTAFCSLSILIINIVDKQYLVQDRIALEAVHRTNQDLRDIETTLQKRYRHLHKSETKFYAYWAQVYTRQMCEDWHFFIAVIRHESNFNHAAISPVGAKGLMQLMDETKAIQYKKHGIDNKRNCYNIDIVCGMDELMRNRGESSLEQLLRRYNSGSKTGHSKETNDFVNRVMAEVDTLKQIYMEVRNGGRR